MADIWNDLTDAIGVEMAIQEMQKKYLNTHLTLIKPDGSQVVVYYMGYANEGHIFQDPLGTKIRLKHDTQHKLICEFPERRLFNHEGVAFEFIRKPNRQNRRGICKDNVMISSPIRRMFGGDSHNWTIHTLVSALNPVYPTCAEALKMLDNEQAISVAISPKFAVTQSFTKGQAYFLLYSNVLIGCFKDNKFTIKHSLFKQEVLDNMELFKSYEVEF